MQARACTHTRARANTYTHRGNFAHSYMCLYVCVRVYANLYVWVYMHLKNIGAHRAASIKGDMTHS